MMRELGQMKVELSHEKIFKGNCHLAMLLVPDRREQALVQSLAEEFLRKAEPGIALGSGGDYPCDSGRIQLLRNLISRYAGRSREQAQIELGADHSRGPQELPDVAGGSRQAHLDQVADG